MTGGGIGGGFGGEAEVELGKVGVRASATATSHTGAKLLGVRLHEPYVVVGVDFGLLDKDIEHPGTDAVVLGTLGAGKQAGSAPKIAVVVLTALVAVSSFKGPE